IPFSLNLFSAGCAAITLGLLARSVAILPHDRTDAQRKREHSDFAFLTIPFAWFPPVVAVMIGGLQLTYWQHATNYTGEMFDLLLFAFLVWSLLEYRLDERETRLFVAAFVFGAGMAENWAIIGYFPLFIGALIWIRGWGFFNLQFLLRMMLLGFIGLLFYLMLPIIAVSSGNLPITFWDALKANLSPIPFLFKYFFRILFHPMESAQTLSLVFAYLFPVLVLSLRWRPSFGDRSPVGVALTTFVFHVVHAAFLSLLVWMSFDPAFSLRHLSGNAPMLTFFYLGALSVGYYTGYFLLVFGKRELPSRKGHRPPRANPLNPFVFGAVLLFVSVAVLGLAVRNLPQIRQSNGDTLWRYASLLERQLPKNGGYIVSDDLQRLALIQSALARAGREKDFVPVQTPSLLVPAYHRFLHKRFPTKWPEIVSATQTNILNPIGLIQVLSMLSRSNELYYLHPSFGYYFEAFYQEPHGLLYQMKPLPEDTLLPPKANDAMVAENEAFWTRTVAPELARVQKAIAPSDPDARPSLADKVFDRLHITSEPSSTDAAVAAYYSRSLDFWGVQLQRADHWDLAADRFETATNLNPDNIVARINLEFNQQHRAGQDVPVELSRTTPDHFGKYGTWKDMLNADGPFDEPSFCYCNGGVLAHANGYFRQSVGEFHRVVELEPHFLPARLELAGVYLTLNMADPALAALELPLSHPERFSLTDTDQNQLAVVAAVAYFQKNDNVRGAQVLENELARHPDDPQLLAATAHAFLVHGLFTNALTIINHKLKTSPNEPDWLYCRGYVDLQLKNYREGVADLTRVLAVQTNNFDALFNRAIASLQMDDLDAARADYTRLQVAAPESVPVAYGLGEIAWRKHETNEAVRNFQIYLAHTDTNSPEAKVVADRLRQLKEPGQ
ncbi:MAG TPA: hypothetical protein VN625_11115, partial [Desulfuromonadaceae bacterium]|nr:hypothetical protein [Desulfuromonadaceae bacterium]